MTDMNNIMQDVLDLALSSRLTLEDRVNMKRKAEERKDKDLESLQSLFKDINERKKTMGQHSVHVVKYRGAYHIWYKTNASGKAQLIDRHGRKCPGTPSPTKLHSVRTIPCKEFNNSWYFKTKLGVFSAATGKKISSINILALFDW